MSKASWNSYDSKDRDYYRKDDWDAPWNRGRVAKSKKDTKRWCKGKEGREHQTEVVLDPYIVDMDRAFNRPVRKHCGVKYLSWRCWHIERCVVCGKHLRHLTEKDCPDNVRD